MLLSYANNHLELNTSDVLELKIFINYSHSTKVSYQPMDLCSAEKYVNVGTITAGAHHLLL
jgi:hypothetical protein